MRQGRQADSARRRQRVITALSKAATDGGIEISVAGVARTAGVDRSFLYRHRDLLEKIHALETAPPDTHGSGPAVSRASLQADLLASQDRAARMHARITQLERRLSELLGEQAWHDSGLGAPATSMGPPCGVFCHEDALTAANRQTGEPGLPPGVRNRWPQTTGIIPPADGYSG
jgi:hypothetical protein